MRITMRETLLLFVLCTYSLTVLSYSFTEEFTEDWTERWIASKDEKYKGKFERTAMDPDFGLQIPKKALFYGLTAPLTEAFNPAEGLILQFEAKWSKDQTCSGAYLKFYSHDSDFKPEEMKEDTPYTIMFGPDKCGSNSKVHFILNHKSPKTSKVTEKHSKDPAKVPGDKKTHIYTAILKIDQSFEILLDNKEVSKGSLLEKFDPPINPPEEIPDPDDHKPEDWVDLAKIDDPDAVKPADWVDEELMEDDEAFKPDGWLDDEPLEVPDPDATKPEDWDEDEDGEWIAPSIPNPKCKKAPGCGEWQRPQIANPDYKGPWRAPKIDNPEYKGEWKAKLIPNPEHFVDEAPLSNLAPIGSVGFELWTMDAGIVFDNIIITQDPDLAKKYRSQWETRHQLEEAKEEEELAKRKEQQSKDKGGAAGFLQSLIEDPRLEILKPLLQPMAIFAEENTTAFYAVFAFIFAMLFVTVMTCCRRRPQDDEVGERKKKDITESDITEPSNTQSTSKATNGTEAESKEKEKEEEEGEEEVKMEEKEEEEGPTKRRTGRTRRVD